jgi:hypothetical protein
MSCLFLNNNPKGNWGASEKPGAFYAELNYSIDFIENN